MESLLDMLKAFESKISILSASLNIKIEFSLKLMVHYGAFTKYQLKNYSKLYGSTIVEAHKLLKNKYAEHPCCILLSNSFLKSSQTPMSEITANSKVFPEIGAILYI
ncbi:hypothetical protein BSF42_37140 [Flavobacterium sp. ACN6]|nr:hypothetical protein BSF42_37140 [Flavobacterium sp. ACN6]